MTAAPALPPYDGPGDLQAHQAGVVSRTQARAAGLTDNDLRRLLRRREWVPVHPGVYIDHTGPLTWLQRAWAAVLYAAPAALCHSSALRGDDGPGRRDADEAVIHVAVDRTRSLRAPSGVVLHRLAALDAKTRWTTSPPRVRVEHAALDVAAEAPDDLGAVAVLADVIASRRTTADRLLVALASRSRIPRRAFLTAVLTDVRSGTCSTLEHTYLTRVERAHGLPTADRQVRDSLKGTVYRDVEYPAYGLVVELDGRLFHSHVRDRDADLDRDLDTALTDRTTVRLGWGQAHQRPCATGAKLGRLLQLRGWSGAAHACPRC